ncbi:uncharacterized protein LOC121779978 [Salvia splendens]|uniref:uncharacterized protein LOC121779978 n=1 Tax=Salvia splendens TaxID=180675 RepID=UPI001C2526CA|nr:uncharacterized protein LOC121779978 [Salvia splendens]XP_042033413.1 uncharacterized protein LOC121779978 [Salvia splendens]
MHTRSRGLPLEPIDLEIEASNRRRNALRRLNQRIRVSSPVQRQSPSLVQESPTPTPSPVHSPIQFEPHSPILMENVEGNDVPPPPPTNAQLQQQLEDLQRQLDQRQNVVPVQNMYAYHGVAHPTVGNNVNANTFELRRGLLQMAENNAFSGRPTEDLNKHLTKFIQICNTTKINGVTDEQIRLRVFPFALEDDAKDWLDSMEPNSIRTWEAMVEKFLEKYYPPSEALKRQSEIISFEMTPQESIRGAWERFKGLMKRCPNHGLNPTHQVLAFYRGCLPEAKRELNLSAGGSLLKKGEAEAMEVIEKVTSNDEGWNNERSRVHRVASATESNHIDNMYKQMELLHKKIDLMGMGPAIQEQKEGVEDVNYIHQGGNSYYNNSRPNQGGGGYNHSGNKVHPNLSYGNPNNSLQPPPGFTVSQGMITELQKKSSEDILNEFMIQSHKNMVHTNQRLEKVENDVHSMTVHMKSLETQISQIAQAVSSQHKPGQFPGQPNVNPKDCKAIYLRSGTSYESPPMPEVEAKEAADEKEEEKIEVESPPMQPEVQPEAIVSPTPKEVKIHFPQVVQKKKLDEKLVKFLEIFKRVHLNIPLIEALQQMPGYLKFLKEIVSKKKRLVDYETVNLTENCSAIIQQKMPAKMKDPGSFNISCVIGNDRQTKALCDLGASINLMPLSFFRKLKFGVLKPTTFTLQMADKSVKYPNGLLENVLVRVNDFIFPMDFVVLDMKEDPNVPLILGRPFLATGKALIDVTKRELTLRHGNKTVILSLLDKMKRHEVEESKRVEEVPLKVEECKMIQAAHVRARDPLEEIFMPEWLFEDEHGLGGKKMKVAKVEIGIPKEDVVGADVKLTWWKKRLHKLYLAAKAKKGPDDIIRVRLNH